MAFLDEFKDRAVEIGAVAAAKSKQVAEIAKLNLVNAAEEASIRKTYMEIGKLYYAEQGLAPGEGYVALCEKITASKTTIEENRGRIAQLRAESGETGEEASPETPLDGDVEDFFDDVTDLLEGEKEAPAAPPAEPEVPELHLDDLN